MNDTMNDTIQTVSLSIMKNRLDHLAEVAASANAEISAIKAELMRRYVAQVNQAYAQAMKDHGTLNIDLPDGWGIKAKINKSVKYDSRLLMDVAAQMPWERAQKLFKVNVSMTETLYKALDAVDPDLKAKVDEGRTETLSSPSIELVPPAA